MQRFGTMPTSKATTTCKATTPRCSHYTLFILYFPYFSLCWNFSCFTYLTYCLLRLAGRLQPEEALLCLLTKPLRGTAARGGARGLRRGAILASALWPQCPSSKQAPRLRSRPAWSSSVSVSVLSSVPVSALLSSGQEYLSYERESLLFLWSSPVSVSVLLSLCLLV
jgi:hypothetical protein